MTQPLSWDPVVDPPATIAIIGGGPIGIETAIYARFLGYHVSIFEQRRVGHRMLDWHERPLAVPASECTTSLGRAAIVAQFPEYSPPPPEHVYTGKTYAEEYLIPLAKTDLLFENIHFFSPVTNISRLRTRHDDSIDPQERCNDEFRLLVAGRHRGPWTARADVVIDCRGNDGEVMGLGPGGGVAIGELELRSTFLNYSPLDRRFEPKWIANKHLVLVGESFYASLFAEEFAQLCMHRSELNGRLTWIVHPESEARSLRVQQALQTLESLDRREVQIMEGLGVEQIQRREDERYVLTLLNNDDSTVEIEADGVAAFTQRRYRSLGTELYGQGQRRERLRDQTHGWTTDEPGMYVLSGGALERGAGTEIANGFQSIRALFAMISERSDLDLYSIIELHNPK